MKSTVKHYAPVALLMAGLVLLGALVTAAFGTVGLPREGKTVVTTSYPLYLAATRVAGESGAVRVVNLMGNAVGCAHDYQLTPQDRILLEQADLILLGAEGGGLLGELADTLPTVDTTAGIELLCSDHDHGHDAEHDHGHGHADTYNEHLWMSPWRYRAQVNNVARIFSNLDAANAATYLANGDAYGAEIAAMGDRLQAAAATLPTTRCVIFHDSLAYLAESLGLTVELALSVGEDSGVAAADLRAVQQVLTRYPDTLLLYDTQYDVRYGGVDGLVPARQVLALDTVVAGDRHGDDWLDAMEYNLTQLTGE